MLCVGLERTLENKNETHILLTIELKHNNNASLLHLFNVVDNGRKSIMGSGKLKRRGTGSRRGGRSFKDALDEKSGEVRSTHSKAMDECWGLRVERRVIRINSCCEFC